MQKTAKINNWITDILLLIIFISMAFSFLLGSRPLNVPDEGRYCEIAREMLVSGNFITPHINSIKYFEKPPLFYWMQAASLHFFGLNEWACRLADALMALLGCIGVYVAGRHLFNRRTGLFSAIILSSSLLFLVLARLISLDMTVSIWICFSLLSFILGVYYSKIYYYFLYIFAALAVLTKGLIGIIFPGSIIFLWLLFTQHWKLLKECRLLSGLLIFLLITLPWHILVQIKNPEFFQFYFMDQQFYRYFTLEAHRYGPNWYYIPLLVMGLFPWTGFLLGTIKNFSHSATLDEKNKKLFLWLSTVFIFVFFSFSKSKLIPYILPCFPFFAILLGQYFSRVKFGEKTPYLWAGFLSTSAIAICGAILIYSYVSPEIALNIKMLHIFSGMATSILIFNSIIIPFIFWRKNFVAAFAAQVILMALFLFSFSAAVMYIYMDSVKSFAVILNRTLKSNDIVAVYDYYYQDLPFYLNRNIMIVGWKGELEFGSNYLHPQNILVNHYLFWEDYWNNQSFAHTHNIYLILPKTIFKKLENTLPQKHFYIISETKNDILISSHPLNR